MEKEKLTQNEVVIHQLMEGDPLTSKDIAEKVSSGNGADMDVREVSTIMNKLNKTALGHFIKKKRKGRAFEYQIVDEAKYLTPEEAYGLSLKIGKDRYPLEQALEDHPDLKKHVKGAKKRKKTPAKTREKATAGAGKADSPSQTKHLPVKFDSDMDAETLQGLIAGLLKMAAGENELNVNVDVTIRFDK
jgi:predicted transcriptional regulator